MIQRSYIISYLKAGYLLHIVSLVEITLIVFFYNYWQVDGWLFNGYFLLKFLLLLPLFIAPVFPQLDARSRFQNYKQIKDHLYTYGFDTRLVKLLSRTRCQRCAAQVAAEELGMGKTCKNYFYSQGYRWYHLFPDFLFNNPRHLVTKEFWMHTFFAKTYTPRINFRPAKKSRTGSFGLVLKKQVKIFLRPRP